MAMDENFFEADQDHVNRIFDSIEARANNNPVEPGPEWACCGCGNHDRAKFRTIRYDVPGEPIDYDMECTDCGSTEIEESVAGALSRVISQRDELQDQLDRIKAGGA